MVETRPTPPWPEDRRFRRLLLAHLAAWAVVAALVALVPVPERTPPPPPERPLVRLTLPAPAPTAQARPRAEKKPIPARREPRPARKPKPRPSPRERVQGKGLLALADELGDLRADPAAATLAQARARAIAAPEARAPRRALARAGSRRAGEVSALRAVDGGREPALAGREVTRVTAPADDIAGEPAPPAGRPGRTQEEIQLVFERHKGEFDRLYSRALRRNPDLGGRVTFEFAIAPSGRVLRARILHSDLGDPALERRLLTKLKTLDFGAKDVETTVVTYWIDFLG